MATCFLRLLGLMAVCLALAPAAPAGAGRTRCPTAHTVLRSADGVIFTRSGSDPRGTTLYYGCLFRTKKVYRLGQRGDFGDNAVHRTSLRLAGRFVAYEQDWGSGAGGALNTISVRNLRTGVVVHQAEVSRRGADFGDHVSDVALKRSGSVAWIAQIFDQGANRASAEVRAVTRATRKPHAAGPILDAPQELATGPDIGAASLVLSRDATRVRWDQAGEIRTAPLD